MIKASSTNDSARVCAFGHNLVSYARFDGNRGSLSANVAPRAVFASLDSTPAAAKQPTIEAKVKRGRRLLFFGVARALLAGSIQ